MLAIPLTPLIQTAEVPLASDLVIQVDEKVVVTDLNSTNGTFLGNDRVMELVVEDTITFRVGVTEIRIVSENR